jgi:hypothetical protein
MAKAEATVEELVGMIERGELRLPEMQRRYVWRSTRVRDLMDSLYRGYPSGAILLWETDTPPPLQDFAVAQQQTPFHASRLLLDGQQRLTSLSAVIRGEAVTVRGRRRPIELLFNLDHPDQLDVVTEVYEDGSEDDEDNDADDLTDDEADSTEDELLNRFNRMTFVVSTKKLERLPQWVRVTDVFKSDSDRQFMKEAGVKDLEDPRHERYSQRLARLRAIRRYVYRMDVLERSLSYNEVTEIFVRVNSLGAKLRSSDLALAQITAKWVGALATFQRFQNDCEAAGFDLDLGIHLKNLVSFATGQSRFLTVSSIRLPELQQAWDVCTKGMEFTLNFMKSNVRLDNPALLSSPYILITLANYFHSRSYSLAPTEEQRLRDWVLIANAKGRYSRGSSETILDQDLAIIRDGGDVSTLLDRLRLQVGRLDISAEELEGRNQLSSVFKTMFLAFREAGAQDWQSKLAIALGHRGATHKLQFHHIFPKKVLKQQGIYSRREIDDIANLAFIGGKLNREISDQPPSEYLEKLVHAAGESAFAAQCIPLAHDLRDVGSYRAFLATRRQLIADRLNDYLGVSRL